MCPKQKTIRFLKSLGIRDVYLSRLHDRCYCERCWSAVSMPDVLDRQRADGNCYEVPKGWYGAGLKMGPRAEDLDI